MKTFNTRSWLLLLVAVPVSIAHAQTVQWMHQGGTSGQGLGISATDLGECLVAGGVGNPALFDQLTVPSHFADAFIAKYDAAGDILWVRTAGGELIDQANDITSDADGNAYVTGSFSTNGPFPSVSFENTEVQGVGSSDLFLAKYDPAGTLLWVRSGGGTQAEEGRGVALTTDGDVVVSGFFQGTAVFGDDTLVSAGLSDILLLKYDTDGNLLWSTRAGSNGDDKANKLTACANGDVAVVGGFQSSFTMGNTIACSGLSNIFLARFNANGTALWATRAGSTVTFIADQAYDIANAPNGDLVFCGEIAGPADFGGLPATPNGGIDLFLARYTGDGDPIWVHHAGGELADHAYGVAVDAEGSSYLTGQADSGANTVFDSITLAPFGNEAVFLAKYDAAGAVQWVKRYAPGAGRAVHALADGCLYFTGGASGIVGQPAFDAVPWQYVDRSIFTARFCGDIAQAVIDGPATDSAHLLLFPNPAADRVTLTGLPPRTALTVFDGQGRIVYNTIATSTLDVAAWAEGLYILQARSAREVGTRIPFIVTH